MEFTKEQLRILLKWSYLALVDPDEKWSKDEQDTLTALQHAMEEAISKEIRG